MCSSLVSSGDWCCLRRGRSCCSGCRLSFLLAELQRTNVSDDGPTILNRNLRCVSGHRAPAVRDRVEEMTYGRLAQAIVIERCGSAETAAHDHAIAISGKAVADTTEDLVTLTTALNGFFRDWKRKRVHVILVRICTQGRSRHGGRGFVFLAGEQLLIRTQKTARNRALDRLSARQSVTEERRSTIRLHLRLVLHVAPARPSRQANANQQDANSKFIPRPQHR